MIIMEGKKSKKSLEKSLISSKIQKSTNKWVPELEEEYCFMDHLELERRCWQGH